MLHGFSDTLADFHLEPEKTERVLDMVLDFKLEMFDELHRRFGDRIDGLFCTDDWGSQQGTFIGGKMFEDFFLERYRRMVQKVHDCGWHCMLHSCGRVNDFVPYFIDVGFDVLNLQQPRAYGIEELGEQYAGKVCFLTTADIQATIPRGVPEEIREEVRLLGDILSSLQMNYVETAKSAPQQAPPDTPAEPQAAASPEPQAESDPSADEPQVEIKSGDKGDEPKYHKSYGS